MNNNSSGAVYGLGFVGALVYYVQHTASASGWLIGLVKALLWPAMLVYKLLGM